MILVKGLCKGGRVDEVVEVLGQMREKLCKPEVFAYTAMVRVLVGGGGNVDMCLRVWDEMRRDRVELDGMAYGTLVMGAIYGSLVEAFVADGKVGVACDLLKDLIDSGYRADLAIYNSLVKGLCNLKQVDKAWKLFEVTVQDGLEPDFATVNPMLVCFAGLKRMDDFCTLLLQMKNLGFSILDDLSGFFSFMVGKDDRIMLALEVLEELKVKGYCSVPIYNILMEALHKIGEIKGPSSIPSIAAYCSLVKGLCKIGEIDAAMMLIRDCLANVTSGPLEFKYTLTIIRLCRSNNVEKVIDVINEMMQVGCPPDDIIYSAVISGMCKHGTLEEARKVFSSMRARKLLTEANLIVYDDKLVDHMKKKTADLVLSGLKFFGLESKLKAKGCRLLPA
ncbi:pentatricopeptide repeat (PPR-like) superfamily protein [Actinidia rufa]|uniref:Pentatricopeptide repeat (PPR-like) superfamily protein n=1 Tax=Actinidia rufa TaxID=165716 RepID=A0A7J0F8L8_9ERIC|nr:pentatricopeptide repeat (PPR-like) superfamily protein [Actinidia rufa]